ncbi:hypothetical protein [Kribbella ginsengisoli]|uniref:ATP-grasp domain-containing protein n=1 Tax=Kribbella ginsengisoli TaxID=363865 RepID=A0ABP6VNX3_9ACTN
MTIPIKPAFPSGTRLIISLFESGSLTNVSGVDVEPDYGYITRIRYLSGAVRVTYGSNIGINPSAASEVVKDKGYAKKLLSWSGFDCPPGETFVLPWWAARIKSDSDGHSSVESLLARVDGQLQYPVYVKPVDGSKGVNVWRCRNDGDLVAAIRLFDEERIRVAVVECAVDLPDFRLAVLDGGLVAAYQRLPLSIVGDGRSSISGLLQRRLYELASAGRKISLNPRDGRVSSRLVALGAKWEDVPAGGQVVQLLDLSNLSAGGTPVDLTTVVHPRWTELACRVAREFGLRLCGVDLACNDLTKADGAYSVLEVNASPGLDHYSSLGIEHDRRVRDLYQRLLNSEP